MTLMGLDSQRKDPCPAGDLDRGTLVVIMQILSLSKRRKWTSQENKIAMECYLLSEPKISGYRKRLLSGVWLQKGMFLVSEQRLVE